LDKLGTFHRNKPSTFHIALFPHPQKPRLALNPVAFIAAGHRGAPRCDKAGILCRGVVQLKAGLSSSFFAQSMMMMMMRLVRAVSMMSVARVAIPWSKGQKRKEKLITQKQTVPQMIWEERLCGEPRTLRHGPLPLKFNHLLSTKNSCHPSSP